MIFRPTYVFNDITCITPKFLKRKHIKGIVLDIDNTLTTHNNPVPPQSSMDWLARVKKAGIKLIIVSNNKPPRVEPFAQLLDLEYVANGRKPLTYGINEAVRRMGFEKCDIAAIGDQIFTDVFGANRVNMYTILVKPIHPKEEIQIVLKRYLEKIVLWTYRRELRKSNK